MAQVDCFAKNKNKGEESRGRLCVSALRAKTSFIFFCRAATTPTTVLSRQECGACVSSMRWPGQERRPRYRTRQGGTRRVKRASSTPAPHPLYHRISNKNQDRKIKVQVAVGKGTCSCKKKKINRERALSTWTFCGGCWSWVRNLERNQT